MHGLLIILVGVLIALWGVANDVGRTNARLQMKNESAVGKDSAAEISVSQSTPPAHSATRLRATEASRINQSAVALWLAAGPANTLRAKALFDDAARRGDIQARYNLSVVVPLNADTDAKTVTRIIGMLRENVAQGDVPSMVSLAAWLGHPNATTTPNTYDRLRRDLLRHAAQTGDADYQMVLGQALLSDMQRPGQPNLLPEAIKTLRMADKSGHPLAAEAIGDLLNTGGPSSDPAFARGWTDGPVNQDPLVWYEKAGNAGSITARCAYGLRVYQPLQVALESNGEGALRAALAQVASQYSASSQMRAKEDLALCAMAIPLRREKSVPFGTASNYLPKSHIVQPEIGDAPDRAAAVLALLQDLGLEIPVNSGPGRSYLDKARSMHMVAVPPVLLDTSATQ